MDSKNLILRWLDKDESDQNILELRKDIQQRALDTDVRHIPEYAPINLRELIDSVIRYDSIKDHLDSGDRAYVIISNNETANFNIDNRIDFDSIESMATRETQTSYSNVVLIVKKPDFLGNSMWEFRHGPTSLIAKIEHEEWLKTFQNRNFDVRPGDAIRCRLRTEVNYGHDNELLSQRNFVENIIEILEDEKARQIALPFDGASEENADPPPQPEQ